MIIWINGSFGVGKTTVAGELKGRIRGSIVYDPEEVGAFLTKVIPEKKNDFQDHELWRTINYEILRYLNSKHQVIVVPMTVTDLRYYDEIIGRLKRDDIRIEHFILTASRENIIDRLDARGNSTEWAYGQVDRCIKAFDDERFMGHRISTDGKSASEVCTGIIELMKIN